MSDVPAYHPSFPSFYLSKKKDDDEDVKECARRENPVFLYKENEHPMSRVSEFSSVTIALMGLIIVGLIQISVMVYGFYQSCFFQKIVDRYFDSYGDLYDHSCVESTGLRMILFLTNVVLSTIAFSLTVFGVVNDILYAMLR